MGTRELSRGSQVEKVARLSDLDCKDFANCRWRNVPDDELDWSRSTGVPDPMAWQRSMSTKNTPAGESAVIASPFRPASDNARLVSDPIGCMFGPMDVTLTVWRNVDRVRNTQSAKLHVCSRLVGEAGSLKQDQCATVEGANGQPTTVRVRPPVGGGPAELVIVGDNFVTLPHGAAIFIRQVKVDGPIGPDCSSEPGLAANRLMNDTADQQRSMSAFDAPNLADSGAADACQELSFSSDMARKWDTPFNSNSTDGVFAGWRFANNKGGDRDPPDALTSTGIRKGPLGVDQFAVASFDATRISRPTAIHLVSRSVVNIPSQNAAYYYCFEEFMTSPTIYLQLCENAGGTKCFYRSLPTTLRSPTWTRSCPKLPTGTYKVHVIARYDYPLVSSRVETTEVGFVPDVVTTDVQGTTALC